MAKSASAAAFAGWLGNAECGLGAKVCRVVNRVGLEPTTLCLKGRCC